MSTTAAPPPPSVPPHTSDPCRPVPPVVSSWPWTLGLVPWVLCLTAASSRVSRKELPLVRPHPAPRRRGRRRRRPSRGLAPRSPLARPVAHPAPYGPDRRR